jgi:3-methyladenine DNA glycosylase AlkD
MTGRIDFVTRELAAAADTSKAAPMARYMKTTDPFYGVQKAGRVTILREMKRRFPVTTAAEYEQAVLDLWSLPHREEKYLALAVATGYREFIAFDRLPLYRRLITEGAWWDFVDDIAARAVGMVWMQDRERTTPVMTRWIDDPDMWLRRTAIIGQLKHKEQTDAGILFDFCSRRSHETEFFVRKAIGWALREYAKTDPDAVRAFALTHREQLSGLSFREATKHLDLS